MLSSNRRALVLLTIGGVIGSLLGIATALNKRGDANGNVLPDRVIVSVNGKPIRAEDYLTALALLAGDKRTTRVTDEDRSHVLNRLIEEELLIQRGGEIGLVDSDRTVRKIMTQAMLAAIVAESASEQPSAEDLHAFYEENPSLFGLTAPETNLQVAAGEKVLKPPTFAEIRDQVEKVYLQRSRDNALREYLQWLRDEAKIAIAPEMSR